MKKYQYILLDWDGNLAQTLDVWLEAFRIPLEKRGLSITDEDIASSFGMFPQFVVAWGLKDVDAIVEEADKLAKIKMPEVDLYPDALEVLNGLRDMGKHLALVTTTLHENVRHLLEKFQILDYFEVIVAGDDVTNHKPHPESLERALSLLVGRANEAIMIGDSDKDLRAANNAGIDSVLFFPPEHRKFYNFGKLKEHKPTYVIEDFRKLLDIVGE